jgi:hypothetical protein
MAIDFSNKMLVTNPTTYNLGRTVVCTGIAAIGIGLITQFTGDVLLPSMAWCVFGTPTIVIGVILMRSGLTRN